MIVDFSVQNFGPFRDRAVLSMEPAAIKDDEFAIQDTPALKNGILKAAAIFGANASGKTFLVDAMGCLKELVNRARSEGDHLPGYIPFAFSKKTSSEPVCMEIRLVIDDILYAYEIAFDNKHNSFPNSWTIDFSINA